MEPTALAAAVTALFAPFLAKAAQKTAEKIGEALPEQLGRIWNAVGAKLRGRPAADEAVKDFAIRPADSDNQAAFRKELRKALDEDAEFARQLIELLGSAAQAGVNLGDYFAGDNAFKVENNSGTIVYGGDNIQNIGNQISDSNVGGDVTGHDKISSG